MSKVLLVILDGWGINSSVDNKSNATSIAKTPTIDNLIENYPNTSIQTSGVAVGLPKGQMGNSEVGHLTLGSGRVIFQELTRINRAIECGSLVENSELIRLIDKLKESNKALHLMGLLSDGGVHSHINHLYAIIKVAKERGLKELYVHAFMDGRDTPPKSGLGFIRELEERLKKIGLGRIATVMGRFYAMDRDKRWERVELAFLAMVRGVGVKAATAANAIENSYTNGKTDEFIEPAIIAEDGENPITINNGDGVLFFNFRADRARELTMALAPSGTVPVFDGFDNMIRPNLSCFATMTGYDESYKLPVLFPPKGLKNMLGEVLSREGLSQFRISETEKYAHVTFFFNGGRDEPFSGEERHLISSVRDVATYDLCPEMRAAEIAEYLKEKILKDSPDFILVNFANGDMVGHTGILEAAVSGCEAVDRALAEVLGAAKAKGYAVIITADHGNAEEMIDKETGESHTAHTTNPVPFIFIPSPTTDESNEGGLKLREGAGLSDVAPTVLRLMGINAPKEMEGESII